MSGKTLSENYADQRLKQAIVYADAGFPIIRLSGKRALDRGWQHTEVMYAEEVPKFMTSWRGNFGVVLGSRDLVIDIDPRRFAGRNVLRDFMKTAKLTKEAIYDTAAVIQTGGGGLHIYMKKPKGVSIHKEMPAWPGMEFRTGGYLVAVSGIHPDTKRLYTWKGGRPLKEVHDASPSLLGMICRSPKPQPLTPSELIAGSMDEVDAVVKRYVESVTQAKGAVEGERGDDRTYVVACRGRDLGLSVGKTIEILAEHYNPRCEPPWSLDDLQTKVQNAYEYASQPTGNDLPETQFVKIKKEHKTDTRFSHWDVDRSTGEKKKSLNNTGNFFLLKDQGLLDTVGFDSFSGRVFIQARMPWWKEPHDLPIEWSDHDSIDLRMYLSRNKKFDVSLTVVQEALINYARTRPFHPLQDYLTGLVWDKTPRVDTFLQDACGADKGIYTRAISKVFFLQAVNRAMKPGCKADYVIVFESDQGKNKSQMLEILGGKWFADLVIDTHHKDTIDAMRGKWFIEMAEMEITRRADAQALKAFITRGTDRIRLPYARQPIDLPRSCVFAGTINPDDLGQYLSDTTGNRRFLPTKVRQIDLKKTKADRDQLFAEALYRLNEGEKPFIQDTKTLKRIEIEQSLRETSDPWQVSVTEYLALNNLAFTTTKALYVWAVKGSEAQLTVGHCRRIARCLRELGYQPHSKRINGHLTRGYQHPVKAEMLKRNERLKKDGKKT